MVPTCPRCARVVMPTAESCLSCGTLLRAMPQAPRPATPNRRGGAVTGGALAASDPGSTANWHAPPLPPPSRTHGDPLIGAVVAGRFRIEELVGQGGMGKVYRARHLSLDKAVCLKMLKPALLEDPTLVGRFEREAKAASRLNHPNSIAVLDFGREERTGSLYIAMEYVQGKDLRLVLRDEWPLPESRVCNIMAQVLAALGEAHAQNVIHRDLKPENIMVELRRGVDTVKVLDFGIAKILDSDLPGLTRSDVVCGTPQYMAPEQATGSALDARCDLYAVGVILYQLVTGHLPFDGQNSMEVLTKHVNDPPIPPSQRQPGITVSAQMEAIILRAMSKDPMHRPQTALEFRDELLTLVEPRSISAPRITPIPSGASAAVRAGSLPTHERHTPVRLPTAAARRPRWMVPALVGAVLSVLAAAGLFAASRTRAPAAQSAQIATPLGAVQRDPERAQQLIAKSSQWQRDGDTGAARDLLEQAVLLDPDNAEAHYRLGNLFHNSQPQRARSEYETAMRLDPQKYGEVVKSVLRDLN